MNKVIDLDKARGSIKVNRSEDFIKNAYKVGAHLSALPLNSEQHNKLVGLIGRQVKEAESTALRQGFDIGVKLGLYLGKEEINHEQ